MVPLSTRIPTALDPFVVSIDEDAFTVMPPLLESAMMPTPPPPWVAIPWPA
jgi:hypothetical protein